MELRLIDPQQVIELLPMSECIEVVDGAMRSASNGEAVMPLRDKMALPGGGLLGWMPGYMASPDVFGVKLVGVFPENFALGMHSHHGVVVLFETRHGRPFAVVDASEITAIRTAAASAMATRLLAREDASALAIMGYGAQGRQHLESMLCVRDFTDIRVWGRHGEKAQAFAREWGPRFGVDIRAVDDARTAVEGAHVICTVTASPDPILLGDWLEPGQHINAVGTSFPGIRELDTEAVVRSRLYVDLRAGAIAQAGEFQMARDEGAIDESHILGEIGEVALGRVAGRESPSDITLYKSLGLVVQDLASAYHVYENATGRSVGVTAQF
jgi:ornithine cyclodeaminase